MARLTLSVAEAAEALGVSKTTVYGAIDRGELPSVRIAGRVLIPKVGLSQFLGGESGGESSGESSSPTVPLATSRYQSHQLIIDSGFVPVRTTLGAPRWKLKYPLTTRLSSITPTRPIFAIRDTDEFVSAYRAHLDEVGVDRIRSEIATISVAHSDRPLVLLCFEDVEELGERSCHRRVFARWWQEKTGQEVPELGVRKENQ